MKRRVVYFLSVAFLAALGFGIFLEYPRSEFNNELTELRAGYEFNLQSYFSLSDESADRTLKAVTAMVNSAKEAARLGLEQYNKAALLQRKLTEAARAKEDVPKAPEPSKEPEIQPEKPVQETVKVDRKTEILTESLNGSFDGFATEMLRQINEYRTANGVGELKLSSICVQAANVRVLEQATAFSHTRPNGTRFLTVYDDIGYGDIFEIKGENLQKHSDASYDIDTASLVTEAIENFKLSESHNALMLSGNYNYVGFAVYFPGDGLIFIAQEFGN